MDQSANPTHRSVYFNFSEEKYIWRQSYGGALGGGREHGQVKEERKGGYKLYKKATIRAQNKINTKAIIRANNEKNVNDYI